MLEVAIKVNELFERDCLKLEVTGPALIQGTEAEIRSFFNPDVEGLSLDVGYDNKLPDQIILLETGKLMPEHPNEGKADDEIGNSLAEQDP